MAALKYCWPADVGHLVDGERIIVAVLPDGAPKVLAGSGAAIWQLANGATVQEIAAELASIYRIDPAGLLEEINTFCVELVTEGFLTVEN